MFRKRKLSDEMYLEALQELKDEKEAFKNDINNLRDDLCDIKSAIVNRLNVIQKEICNKKSSYNKLHTKTLSILNSRKNAEHRIEKIEEQLHAERVDYSSTLNEIENELDITEASVLQLRLDIHDKDDEIKELKNRLSYVDESNVSALQDDSKNLNSVRSILSSNRNLVKNVNEMWKDISECVNEQISDDGMCIICKSKQSKYAYSCGHLCTCEDCFTRTQRQCPYCRKKSDGIRIYKI